MTEPSQRDTSSPAASAPSDAASRRLILAAVALAGAGGGAWYAWQRLGPSAADAGASQLFYALSLPDAQGSPIAMAAYAGQTVVLNFWATWCPPCIDEMPELSRLHEEIRARKASVIGIAIDSPGNVREFASKQRIPYPLLVAGMGGTELSSRFGNTAGGLPFTVVIGAKGQIVQRTLGRIKLPALRETVLGQL